jgi:hypothetical protein
MSNMSYCKFENTYHDLQDCAHSLHDKANEHDQRYRVKLIQLCRDIVEEVNGLDDEDLENLGTDKDPAYEEDRDER